jgi:hypothetical protein
VRPGGTLLIVGHHPDDVHANVRREGPGHMFPGAAEVGPALDADSWEIRVAAPFEREARDLDVRPATVRDTVLRAVRCR